MKDPVKVLEMVGRGIGIALRVTAKGSSIKIPDGILDEGEIDHVIYGVKDTGFDPLITYDQGGSVTFSEAVRHEQS